MKRILFVALALMATRAFATQWEIEAGGGGNNGTPYFLPQNLSIMQGDEIIWTWASGQHNVETTSGPVPFDSGSHTAPFTWSFIFEIPGTYEYECSLFNHSNTQFGTIEVGSSGVEVIKPVLAVNFELFPNPASQEVSIEKNCKCQANVFVYELSGRLVISENMAADMRRRIDITTLTPGIYFVELNAAGTISRKRLIVK